MLNLILLDLLYPLKRIDCQSYYLLSQKYFENNKSTELKDKSIALTPQNKLITN